MIDNGTDIPGTILDECSDSFCEVFQKADLIIAKGQGNYETLSQTRLQSGQSLFFLLKVKCPVIARDLGRKVGGMFAQQLRNGQNEGEERGS